MGQNLNVRLEGSQGPEGAEAVKEGLLEQGGRGSQEGQADRQKGPRESGAKGRRELGCLG